MNNPQPVTEQALLFDCQGSQLLGVLSRGADPVQALGVVVVVGGPQYRAGSHRQFVQLARHLAAAGYAVLRFDCRGMGDSAGDRRPFEDLGDDVRAASTALLLAVPAVHGVVLWGLCDGASAALLSLRQGPDARVAGLCLVNPWVRSAASLAKTQVKHYYWQRLQERSFWAKLLSGRVAVAAARDLASNLRLALGAAHKADAGAGSGGTNTRTGTGTSTNTGTSTSTSTSTKTSTRSGTARAAAARPFQERMALAWAGFDGAVLLLLSERDQTAQEFADFSQSHPAWQQALRQRPPQRLTLAGADHTCSAPAAQRAAEEATVTWLNQLTMRVMPGIQTDPNTQTQTQVTAA